MKSKGKTVVLAAMFGAAAGAMAGGGGYLAYAGLDTISAAPIVLVAAGFIGAVAAVACGAFAAGAAYLLD